VTEHSDALTLEGGVFTSKDPRRIAASLEALGGTKQSPQGPILSVPRSSMLTFYINRAGKNLPPARQERR
jgi:hypothetical protein